MDTPLTRLLNVPEVPPRSWFADDSPDFVMGQTLHVVTQGPDEGRAFGLIQPPPDQSAFMPGRGGRKHRNRGRRPPDSRMYPDDFAVFNRGAVEVLDDDGAVSTIAAGRLPLFGGHAQQAVAAANVGEAVEWLHREGRWTHQADALGLVGVASAVDDPRFGGAVMFRGAVIPGMTLREAQAVNSTSTSAEVWESPQYGDQMVFAGAIVCDHTAWPYHDQPDAMAADTDEETDCEGPFCVVFAASGSTAEEAPPVAPQSTPTDSVDQGDPDAPVIARGPCDGCGGCTCGKRDQPSAPIPTDPATANDGAPDDRPTVPPTPPMDYVTAAPDSVAAEGDEAAAALATEQLVAVQTEQTDLRKMIEDLAVEVAEITVTVFGAEGLGSANQLDEMTQQINDLREQVIELLQKIPTAQRESDTDGDRPGNQSITPGPPLGNSAVNQGAIRDLQGALRG